MLQPDEKTLREYPYVAVLNFQTIRFRTAADREGFLNEWGKEGDIVECYEAHIE